MPLCPVHGKPGRIVYMCCVGAAGGKAKSANKTRAVRKNAKKLRPR